MGLLDSNIKNNLFKHVGAIGSTIASQKITEGLRKNLFSKIPGNKFINVGGFLGGKANDAVKKLLFSRKGQMFHFDPVWKLLRFSTPADKNIGLPTGDLSKAVADDFAGADRPKHKFNFTVEFNFRKNINDFIKKSTDSLNAREIKGSKEMATMAFGLKQATRPNPTINYQDVNFYNYRTKIATKIDYGTLTITFYDDVNNRAHDIVANYLQSVSPIARISNPSFANYLTRIGITPDTSDPDVSGIGPLFSGEEEGPIASISLVQHLPIKYNKIKGIGGTRTFMIQPSVEYIFFNPKIMNIMLDDLDMTQNEFSTVSMVFVYDSVYLKKNEKSSKVMEEKANNSTTVSGLNSFLKGIVSSGVSGVVTGAIGSKISNVVSNAVSTTVTSRIDKLNDSTLLKKVKNFIG